MQIGLVSATYDADVVNGVLRMVDLYRRHLAARGHEVTIFALGSEASGGETAGVVRSPGLPLGDYGYYAGLGYTPAAQKRLAEMDIVHCHHLFMSLELAHRYADAPIVYTNHTRYDLYTGSYTRLPQPAADAIMRYAWPRYSAMADHVIAPSAGMARVLMQFNVTTPITVIENGIELHPFYEPDQPRTKRDLGLPDDSILAVYCGRLSAEKGIEQLLALFTDAARQQPRLHLLLIGKGPLAAPLRQTAAHHGLAGRVHFTGAVPYHDVGAYLATGDLFVTVSTSEVHPLTVIEAMAAGLPVVALSAMGTTDILGPERGARIAPDDPDGFAAVVVGVLADPRLRRRLAAEARDYAAEWADGVMAGRLAALYRRLLAAPQAAPQVRAARIVSTH